MLGSHKTTCARLGPDRTKPARNLHHDLHRNSDPQAQRTRYFYYASRYSLDNHPVAVPDLFAIIPDGTIPPNCSTHVTICAQHGAQSKCVQSCITSPRMSGIRRVNVRTRTVCVHWSSRCVLLDYDRIVFSQNDAQKSVPQLNPVPSGREK